jgi:uncharacterized membrane protein YeaQ/YmgE (transglycosylase-associated protein family)
MAHAMIARCQQIAKRRMESAMPSIDHVIVWIVVGLLGGGLAGALMTWERGGFGLWRNLALGLAGAFIGGLLFRIFGIWPGPGQDRHLAARRCCRCNRFTSRARGALALAEIQDIKRNAVI